MRARASGSRNEPNADHNVIQDRGLFRSGPPGRGKRFRIDISAGDWHYYCVVHGSVLGGMDGTIAVRPIAERGDGDSALVRWAGGDSESGNRFEVEWREQGKSWRTWKDSTAKPKLEFGEDGSPTVADPGVKIRGPRALVRRRRRVAAQRPLARRELQGGD